MMKTINMKVNFIVVLAIVFFSSAVIAKADDASPAAAAAAGETAQSEKPALFGHDVSAEASLGFMYTSGEHQSSKFDEYSDKATGAFFSGQAKMEKDDYYTKLLIKNAARSDQEYRITGGKYLSFKYNLFFNEIPHNITYNAATFYQGVGTGNLTYNGQPYWGTGINDVSGFTNVFDYSIRRKEFMADGHVQLLDSVFLDFGGGEVKTDGLRPIMSNSGPNELMRPIDYADKIVYAEVGYKRENLISTIRYDLSSFTTAWENLNFKDPFLGSALGGALGVDTVNEISLYPSNTMSRVGLNCSINDLPFDSTLSLKGSMSWLTNAKPLYAQPVAVPTPPGTPAPLATLSSPIFNGVNGFNNANISLASRPIHNLTTRLYYTFFQKTNDNPTITSTSATGKVTVLGDPIFSPFSYRRSDIGLDAGYGNLPLSSRLTLGYKHTNAFQKRQDALETMDNDWFAKIHNDYLGWADFSLKVDYLARQSQYSTYFQNVPYYLPWDHANKTQWKTAIGADLALIANLDLGLQYIWRYNNYQDTTIGRQKDIMNEWYTTASYNIPRLVKISGFVDVENTQYSSNHRDYNSGSPVVGDPPTYSSGAPTSYDWFNTMSDLSWAYGLSAESPVTDKLTVGLSWSQNVSNTNEDFLTNVMYPLGSVVYDNLRHSLLSIKGTYQVSSKLSVLASFTLDDQNYFDDAYDGYGYKIPTKYVTTNNSNGKSSNFMLDSGGYTDSNYINGVYYLQVSYKM